MRTEPRLQVQRLIRALKTWIRIIEGLRKAGMPEGDKTTNRASRSRDSEVEAPSENLVEFLGAKIVGYSRMSKAVFTGIAPVAHQECSRLPSGPIHSHR